MPSTATNICRYEHLPLIDGEPLPPETVTSDTWTCGAWVNQYGVINGLHSTTHDEAVQGEDAFWERPNLQAYLIRLNGWPAGFACVASPPNATKGIDYRLQEFFVINKARRRGVATAVRMLFDRLPGRWELAYQPNNAPAVAFWKKFIPAYTDGDFTEEMIGMGWCADMPGYVFTKGPRPAHPIKVR
jgi:predicted acetyltransferase